MTGRQTSVGFVLTFLLLAGCIRSDLERVEPGPEDDAPAAGERVDVGERVTTVEGNIVTVHRVDDAAEVEGSDLLLLNADVEICAAEDGEGAPAAPQYFRALIEDEGYRRPAATAKRPPLPTGRLEPGDCARGWVGFPVRPDERTDAIALLASSTVEWVLTPDPD